MATTANSFAALLGAGGEAANNLASKGKKKKSKKQGGSAGTEQAPAPQQAPPDLKQPAAEVKSKAPNAGKPKPAAHPTPGTDPDISVAEAVRHVEKTAQETSQADRVRLWRAWGRQLEEVKAGRGVRYQADDGSSLNFKQVLLKSTALELAAESALSMEGNNAAENDLAQLFVACFPPSSDFVPETLAQVIFRLGHVMPPADREVLRATKKAIFATVAALKSKASMDSSETDEGLWLPRLTAIDSALNARDAALQQLSRRIATPAILKEQVDVASDLVRLAEEKLDLLRSGGSAPGASGTKSSTDVMKAFVELRDLLQQQVKSAPRRGRSNKSDSQSLQSRRAELKEEIRATEANLMRLRSELVDIEGQLSNGAAGQGRPSSEQIYEQYLIAVDALDALLQRSHDASLSLEAEADAAARATEAGAPTTFLSAVERCLQALFAMQADLLASLKTALDKLTRNRRQAQQLSDMSDAHSAVANNRKVKDDLERMIEKIQVDSESVMNSMRKALDRVETRNATLKRMPGHSSRLPYYHSVEALTAQIKSQNDQIIAAIAMRDTEAQMQKRRPVASLHEPIAADVSAVDRVRQLEEMLKAATADLQAKDAQLAQLAHPVSGTVGNGKPAIAPAPVKMKQRQAPVPATPEVTAPMMDALPAAQLAAMPSSAPVIQPSISAVSSPALVDPVVASAAPGGAPSVPVSAPAQPKAAPRGWGKVQTASAVVVDETLPSLADSMAANGRSKRGGKK